MMTTMEMRTIRHSIIRDKDKVLLQGRCIVTGEAYHLTLSSIQYDRWLNGCAASKAFPSLRKEEIDLIITGATQKGMNKLYNAINNEDYDG